MKTDKAVRLSALSSNAESAFHIKRMKGTGLSLFFTNSSNRCISTTRRFPYLEQSTEKARAKLSGIQNWMPLIKEKSTLKYVGRGLLETLIDKIEIGERKLETAGYTVFLQVYKCSVNYLLYRCLPFVSPN